MSSRTVKDLSVNGGSPNTQREFNSPTMGDFFQQYEPINAENRQRNDRDPVGLKNVGNSK